MRIYAFIDLFWIIRNTFDNSIMHFFDFLKSDSLKSLPCFVLYEIVYFENAIVLL